jgi:hypothetical protein
VNKLVIAAVVGGATYWGIPRFLPTFQYRTPAALGAALGVYLLT